MRYTEIITELSKNDIKNQIIKQHGSSVYDKLSSKYKTTREIYLANIVLTSRTIDDYHDHIIEIANSNVDITKIKNLKDIEAHYQILYNKKASTQIDVLYKEDDIKLIKPHNATSAMYYSMGTNWCTGKSKSWFATYNLYIVLVSDKPKYAFSYKNNNVTTWDTSDKTIAISELPPGILRYILENILLDDTDKNISTIVTIADILNIPSSKYLQDLSLELKLENYELFSLEELMELPEALSIIDVVNYYRRYKIDMQPYIEKFAEEYDDFDRQFYNRESQDVTKRIRRRPYEK